MNVSTLQNRLMKQRRFRQILFLSVLIALVVGMVIVPIEAQHPQSNIRNTSDGLWWSIQTLTTVGYGDVVPITPIGRVLGVALVLVGTLMFGVVVAMIGSSMNRSQEEFYWSRLFDRFNRLEAEIAELKKRSEFLVKENETAAVSQPTGVPDATIPSAEIEIIEISTRPE